MVSPGLQPEFSRRRQTRLASWMDQEQVDRMVVTRPEHVQYLTGFRPHRLMVAMFHLDRTGKGLLIAPNAAPDQAVADEIVTFPAQFHSTLRQDQHHAAATVLADSTTVVDSTRIGMEYSAIGESVRRAVAKGRSVEWVDVEPALWQARRRKDPDELALIEAAIACTGRMYARAREIVRPGINELDVYGTLFREAVLAAGEPILDFGNDFQAASPGGPPRDRVAERGELFVLDLGVSYRGYYADNCRTLVVGGTATAEQTGAWHAVVDVLRMIEEEVRPGVSCRAVFHRAQAMLDTVRPGAFFHHLGHGIGLFPHEAPHLNPHWDDQFQAGELFTAEPGVYWDSLRAGIRVEDDYLVTETGVRRLSQFPRELIA
ncbi:MAG: aminopeptidase P family protein [Planctomycetes bacterium]|nr:aminopeptidase P family protein [Planctomycetota bacterium]